MTRRREGRPRSAPRRVLVLLVVVLLAVAVVALLFTVVFPWFDATFVDDPVMGRAGPP